MFKVYILGIIIGVFVAIIIYNLANYLIEQGEIRAMKELKWKGKKHDRRK